MHLVILRLLFESTCLTASKEVISESRNHGGAVRSVRVAVDWDGGCNPHPVKEVTELDTEWLEGILSCK